MKPARGRFFGVLAFASALAPQQTSLSDNTKAYVRLDAPVVALTNVRVIDGTGATARDRQTLILRDGRISEIGETARIAPPAGAETLDLTGRSVIPGLVLVHEHLITPTGLAFTASLARASRGSTSLVV